MVRNTESYRTSHQTQYPAEQSPELADWRKQQAAEHFLENLASQDQQLAQELKQAAQNPQYRPSWLSAKQQQAERYYDSFRLAIAPLQNEEKEYITGLCTKNGRRPRKRTEAMTVHCTAQAG